MPTEADLRDLFASESAPNDLDSKRIIARSRARRLPKQLGAGALGTLVVAGLAVVGVQASQLQPPISAMSDSAAPSPETLSGAGQDTSTVKRAPADKTNLCGGTLAEIAPSFYGLQLDVAFPESAAVGTDPVTGIVRLTNTSGIRVTGTTASSPALTLSQGGLVLWHSNGPADSVAVVVDLAPGESMQYPASFLPVRCDVEDDLGESFRSDLPAVPAGSYDLSAVIDFSPDAAMTQQATPGLDLVSGPRSSITLG